MSAIRLGLIGDNIAASRSPDLHRFCAERAGLRIRYERLVPAELGKDFDAVFAQCRDGGMRGVNITFPYKERAAALVRVPDPEVARLGAVNTVLFGADGPIGHNTDYTGFAAAYRAAFGKTPPGRVALVGAGGVGRAIAFALAGLGAAELRLFDKDAARARTLAGALPSQHRVVVAVSTADALAGAEGVVNCTPVGMVGYPGSPIPAALIGPQRWAFDAVYTPVETVFLQTARRAGLQTISGYELFFHQGIEAFRLFTGSTLADLDGLRRQLSGIPEKDT
jgi:shikimate dehydrogenase